MDNHAPRYLPPVATDPGPKGLFLIASFQRWISRPGMTWVFRAHEHRPSSIHAPCPHSTPATERPRTSMMCAGRPEH
eukprot:3527148-Lingulodinium_polyedra.AAC.1